MDLHQQRVEEDLTAKLKRDSTVIDHLLEDKALNAALKNLSAVLETKPIHEPHYNRGYRETELITIGNVTLNISMDHMYV